ncbi:MAG TPA: pilus assembly protein TadG-related protein [Stellaceae bacterium]|jgi:Flp pilus assembly protein TadG|nr:pilus assembly protein TadG-related protein [Stellaceae bacterium]
MRVRHFFSRLLTDLRGNIGVCFALLLVPILMICGAAVDYSRLEQFKTQLQSTVDSAALAGAAAYTNTDENGNAITVATNYVTSNASQLPGYIGTIAPSVSATQVTSGSNAGNTVTVQATATVGTTFMRMIVPSLPVSASASAVNPTARVCFLITDPDASQALLVDNGAVLNAPNCEIDVISTSTSAAAVDSSLTNIAGLCVGGYAVLGGGATVNNLLEQCSTADNPFAGTIAAPAIDTSCTYSNQTYTGTATLSPGTYCGTLTFNGGGTVTFTAGNYVFYNTTATFTGAGTLSFGAGVYSLQGTIWNLASGWTATGSSVTFYYADSSSYIQVNAGVNIDLSAPSGGTYANILIFEPDGLATSSLAIDGMSTTALLQGLIYLPSRNITFNGTSNASSDGMTLVAHQVIFDNINWNVTPSPSAISGHATGADHLSS